MSDEAKIAEEKAAAEEAAAEKIGKSVEEMDDAEKEEYNKEVEAGVKHRAESRLGRKVKGLEDRMDTGFAEIMTKIESLVPAAPAKKDDGDGDGESSDEEYLTMGDLKKMEKDKIDKATTDQKDYNDTYIKSVQGLGDPHNPDQHKKIVDIMVKHFTSSVSGGKNAMADAMHNYYEAKRIIETGKEDELNLSDGNGKGAGYKGGSNNDTKEKTKVKLTALAQEFADMNKMSTESIEKAMNKDAPQLRK